MTNPWKESLKSFSGVDDLVQMAGAVAVFDKLVLDENMLPGEPFKCKVDEYISQLDEISRLEEQIDKVVFDVQDLQFNVEYKDLLHSGEIERKAALLNEICDRISGIVKNKRILIELLQQKGSSDALPLHRSFHKCLLDLLTTTASLINDLQQNLAIIEQASTMDPMEFRKYARSLIDYAGRLQKFYAELEEITK